MKRFFTFTLSLLIPALLFSQSKLILTPGGDLKGKADEALRVKQSIMNYGSEQKVAAYDVVQGVSGTVDTLGHLRPLSAAAWNTNFGFFGQDAMMQWFVAPADMDIVSIGLRTSDDEGPNISVKLVEVNWTVEQLTSAGVAHQGWYEATGNGFNDIEPTIDNDHEFTVGDWVPAAGNNGLGSPLGLDIWSDGGYGAPVTVDRDETEYSWVSMSLLGFNPSVTQGTVFAVLVKNDSPNLDRDRHGLYATTSGTGVSGFKFYNNGRFTAQADPWTPDPASWGWWSREYSWGIEVEVLLTGDRAPSISDVTDLPTTLSTEARTVEATIIDDNPSGGPAGVDVANLMYTINGGDTITVGMSAAGDVFSADIPGQSQGTDVVYWVETTDVEGLSSQSAVFGYSIFEVTATTLLYFNGYGSPSGYPQSYYFGRDNGTFAVADFAHDAWSYGALTAELVDNYTNIIGIATTGINDDNQDVIAAWLAADAGHNYAVAGDEYLGSYSGWPGEPVPYESGTFMNDILGITVEYSDIIGGSADVTPIRPVMGSALGGAMYQKAMDLGVSIDSIYYDPNYEITVVNWLDGVEITEDSESFMEADSAGGYGAFEGTPAVLSIGHNRTLAEGNKVAFFGYDPLSVNSSPYFWFGFDDSSPMIALLDWFGVVVSVEDEVGTVAKSFNLKQNYPNPFNPTTTIEYTIPANEKVEIKVFNIIGKEVATLVKGKVAAGTHAVEFDASNLASGLYIYQIKAGNNISSKKMLLVK